MFGLERKTVMAALPWQFFIYANASCPKVNL
jgi:hypothetical protein